jgi:circadian clock protein KaiB
MKKKAEASSSTDNVQKIWGGKLMLRLYITGASSISMRAVENLKIIAEKYLKSRYELQVIDIYRQPWRAVEDQIIATPTLIIYGADKISRLVGDLSDYSKVLFVLGINK